MPFLKKKTIYLLESFTNNLKKIQKTTKSKTICVNNVFGIFEICLEVFGINYETFREGGESFTFLNVVSRIQDATLKKKTIPLVWKFLQTILRKLKKNTKTKAIELTIHVRGQICYLKKKLF